MTYIKLLTVLAGLALLTACGGAAAPKTDNTGGDTTTDCETNAFHADCDAHPDVTILRIDTCSGDDDIHATCGAIITSFCTENPHRTFADVCTGDDYLPNRIADCIEGGEADGANCRQITKNTAKNTTLTACLENPFDTACESVPDFMSSFEQARTNRASFCDDSANVADDLCTGDNVTPICKFDQFTAICPDATYGTPRQEACLADAGTNPKCTGAMGIATLFCKDTPFHDSPACKADTGAIALRQSMCLEDTTTNPACTGTEGIAPIFCKANPFDTSNACIADMVALGLRQTMCLADAMEDPSCMGDTGVINTFCKANPFDISDDCMANTYFPLRVADCITADNADETRCNNLFTTTATNDCLTNPFSDACKADGAFTSYLTDAQTKRLSFCVDEPMNTALCPPIVRTCITTPFADACTADVFRLARFNTCEERPNVDGCVNTGDLPTTYPTKPNEVTGSGLLTATNTGLNTIEADIQFEGFAERTISIPHFTGRRGGADSTNPDGFAYFATTNGNAGSIFGYAGILATTNLGAPLPNTTANAVWAGHFSVATSTNVAVNFDVDFDNGEFGFSSANGTVRIDNTTYTMNAVFGSHTDASGYSAGRMGGILSVVDVGLNPVTVPITGLIGEEGAVGVFVAEGVRNSYLGGFTATNPDYITPE